MQRKTKLICLAVLCALVAIAATVVGYQDWQIRASTPANPATGYYRTWADLSTGLIKCITSTGADCFFNPPSAGSPLVLKTNGVSNASQSLLNLVNSTGMSITDLGSGSISFASTGGSSVLLQTNTVNNSSQSLLNLIGGAGITLSETSGSVTISGSTAGPMRALGMAFGSSSGSALTSGTTQYVTIPFACQIKQWDMTVDAGTATVDVWKLASGPADWALASGTVNTVGTAVAWVSGTNFPADAAGLRITINSVAYTIASVTSSTALILTSSAGTQSGVTFAGPGNAVPTVANTITASALPAISTGTAAGSSALTGWSTFVIKHEILGFNIQAVSTAKALSIVLECQQ
jgi:hypothetical protein